MNYELRFLFSHFQIGMTYQQTLDYLYNKLPMFSRIGSAAIKKDLTNTIKICEAIGNPQHRFKSIHIAGTNGKGSVSHMLAAVFQTAGYKTGLYTSPHLYDFRERIKIDGMMADENFIVDFVKKVQPLIEEIEPSFFEITVAMAFEYFAKHNVDVAVIETGLGGRLDSTNIIKPELSIITNIGYDHMNILGNTLQEIAAEKAGIIKENIPVVVGEKEDETASVFEEFALRLASDLNFAEEAFRVSDYKLQHAFIDIEVEQLSNGESRHYRLDLPGIYQIKNILTVLSALDVLRKKGWRVEGEHADAALKNVKQLTGLYGRWEVLNKQPTIVLEVAHNEAGILQMLKHVDQLSFGQLHVVLGMVKDKEVAKALQLLPKNAQYYFTQAQIPRALDKNALQAQANKTGLTGGVYPNVNDALAAALNSAAKEDLIIVCGSIFLVAEVDKALFTS